MYNFRNDLMSKLLIKIYFNLFYLKNETKDETECTIYKYIYIYTHKRYWNCDNSAIS